MNQSVKAEMQSELLKSHAGFGLFAGGACFILLGVLFSLVPGVPELAKTHDWPTVVLVAISVFVGWLCGAMREDFHRRKIRAYDDDELKLEHDKLRDRKLRSYVFWCIAIGLAVAYFLFR